MDPFAERESLAVADPLFLPPFPGHLCRRSQRVFAAASRRPPRVPRRQRNAPPHQVTGDSHHKHIIAITQAHSPCHLTVPVVVVVVESLTAITSLLSLLPGVSR